MCFSGSRPTHFFRSWVRIGIGPTHFLRWFVNYCVCIQHYVDKSQMSFIELSKTLRKNSGLRAVNSFLRLQGLLSCFSEHCFVTAEFKIFISPAGCGLWTQPHSYTDLSTTPLPVAGACQPMLRRPRLCRCSKTGWRHTFSAAATKLSGCELHFRFLVIISPPEQWSLQ